MELFNFTQVIKELCDYYERKEPKPGTLELWFDRVKTIPAEALPWIVKKICQENDAFPKNLPGSLAAMFFAWKQAYPEKILAEQYTSCPDCHEGTIRAWGEHDGRAYPYLFRCGKCRQSNVQGWPMQTLTQLKIAEYEIEHVPRFRQRPGNLRVMVNTIADGMEVKQPEKAVICEPIDFGASTTEVPF